MRKSGKLCFGIIAVFLFIVILGNHAWASGNLRYTVTVSKFENEAGWHGKWDIGDGFTTIMTAALQDSGKFVVLGDKEMRREAMAEQDFAASGRAAGGKKAPKIGRMTPAQLLVRGSITHVQQSTSGGGGGIGFKGFRIGGSADTAEVNITMYLVNSETGQVVASTKLVGKSDRQGLSIGYWGSALKGLTGDMEAFRKDNVGKACEDAVAQGVDFLADQLDEVQWEGTIVLNSGGKVIINRGTREGVATGDTFHVGEVQEIVDPDTGEVLASEMSRVGTIEVTSVKEKIAYGKPVKGGDSIEKGMTVFPAN